MIKDLNKENVSNNEEDIMSILSTEIKNLKKEVKSLRQTIILKGMQKRTKSFLMNLKCSSCGTKLELIDKVFVCITKKCNQFKRYKQD